ncbi:receptor-transporting protein 3 [Alexandromys fortis]|uniref:receptor-transporting protein 3 n=1 Tax=Alexandromys fortis TaxID=100897 RepID=UPI00215282A1|nr:receptor-transporting protein 3 [Microtus fortis]
MMEEDTEVWQQVFQELIQEVKPWHKWTLTPDKDLLPDVLNPGWIQYQQKTFARFICPSCSRSWASGCVLVVFHMRWYKKNSKGHVKMRAFAQRCNRCPEPPFAAPEFSWDNISRILSNLVFRILRKSYGEEFKEMAEIPLLGDRGLEGPHDSNNCEACLQGFCVQSSSGLASKPPACPLSPASSKSTREPMATVTRSNVSCSQPSSKVGKPQASKVDAKASNPTKADPKVSHASNPSTVPILTTQQLAPVSSPAPRCVIQMPSPVKSSGTAGTGNKTSRSKIPEALPPSSAFVPTISSSFILPTPSSYVPPTPAYVVPNSGRPRADITGQVERSSHIHPAGESCCCKACCGACHEYCCRCFCECCKGFCEVFCNCMGHKPFRLLVFLIFAAVVVTLFIKYGI